MKKEVPAFPPKVDENEAREFLLGLFRLLLFDNATFGKCIKIFNVHYLLSHPSSVVRYLATRVSCLYVHSADAAMETIIEKRFGTDSIEGRFEGKRIRYKHFGIWEEQRHAAILKALRNFEDATPPSTSATKSRKIVGKDDLSPLTAEICGLFLPKENVAVAQRSDSETLITTSTTSQNLRRVTECLFKSDPILLSGLAGCGKTLVVKHLARELNKDRSMVTLHLNEQSDAKTLVGIYTSASTPGSFTWKPGVLTIAVQEGRWIFIEDIDRASNEILSTLLPLIERRELLIPSRGETLKAAKGFRIIATTRTNVTLQDKESITGFNMLGIRFWQQVHIAMASTDELREISLCLYPKVGSFISRMIGIYSALQGLQNRPNSGRRHNAGTVRPVTPRDLFKWCRRVTSALTSTVNYTHGQLEHIFLDAVDCFAGSLQDNDFRNSISATIAQELQLDPQKRDHLLRSAVPATSITKEFVNFGRARIRRKSSKQTPNASESSFAETRHALQIVEGVAMAVQQKEPVLLVGETGIGKTSVVQHLAGQAGRKLQVFNLSQQSESGDLLGGYKPVTIQSLVIPMKKTFDDIFGSTFSFNKNQQYLELLAKCFAKGQWSRVCKIWNEAIRMVEDGSRQSLLPSVAEPPLKKQKTQSSGHWRIDISDANIERWRNFAADLRVLERQIAAGSNAFAFAFVEGNIIKAVRNGDWVFLDEINLATSETLEPLADLLVDGGGTPFVMLTESGNVERITAHSEFRIFAAMNPATDIGKKDLPLSIRSRFTELYMKSPDTDTNSLEAIVNTYLGSYSTSDVTLSTRVTAVYQKIQLLNFENRLVDGANQRPHYSLRSLTRALVFARDIAPLCGVYRALYEGFHMSFCTVLDEGSGKLVAALVPSIFPRTSNIEVELAKVMRHPDDGRQYVRESKYWLRCGESRKEQQPNYIITPFVRQNIDNLIRATFTRRFPVLLQGPTSSGKTSMIEYLAKKSGNKFVRINNHEHTDLQEYLGTYVSDTFGRLHFQEGVLVKALRDGHWIVLDELNLAPTDVLEALNRLLDENRELFIPETQEMIRPHEDFMLFATQNPAGLYGGRKALSRAFRNRFLELHFDDIPVGELKEILQQRTQLPPAWCSHIVNVYKELSVLRQENRIFESKSFATLRDLFRWALRDPRTTEELAADGFMLLAERVRKPDEREAVKRVIEKVISKRPPRILIDENTLYAPENSEEMQAFRQKFPNNGTSVVWTKAMRRLFVLVARAIRNDEPVLLIGETGCGKTTVCQMLANALGRELLTVNAHQNTETGDLVGAQRPVRNRAAIENRLRVDLISALNNGSPQNCYEELSLDSLLESYDGLGVAANALSDSLRLSIQQYRAKVKALFEWSDGSLVQAMKTGQFFLLDEISLADDAVLERLNSVLEPDRTLLLAEKGPIDSTVVATEGFQFLATMNPGGDYGKRELSAALRNRFTEIWVPTLSDPEDIFQIVQAKLNPGMTQYASVLITFAEWFQLRYNSSVSSSISLRDLLAWVEFVDLYWQVSPSFAITHGAAMVYIDALGANPSGLVTLSSTSLENERVTCFKELGRLLEEDLGNLYTQETVVTIEASRLRIGFFAVPIIGTHHEDPKFTLLAPTARLNAMRVLRALQFSRPILIEGNPGVGKTTLVAALAETIGKPLTRINLSEQTDLMDLFGSDAPTEGAAIGTFAWRDAPFLRSMRNGDWVLLDEMNLASQSVLEGLNACLDHRGEVYISELDRIFHRHPDFRLFAAQNPHHQGGGRKGLPSSFVNRFTVVYADPLRQDDLTIICRQAFPGVSIEDLDKVSSFVNELDTQAVQRRSFGNQGSPWEFNVRDILRWLQLITSQDLLLGPGGLFEFLDIIFAHRFRNNLDRDAVQSIFTNIFPTPTQSRNYFHNLSARSFQVGKGLLHRCTDIKKSSGGVTTTLRRSFLPVMESLMICLQQNWPVILGGPSGSGKTFLIQQLADFAGADLLVFSMNSDIDAMDLVGAFEQCDPRRQLQGILSAIEEAARAFVNRQICDETHPNAQNDTFRVLQTVFGSDATSWTKEGLMQLHRTLLDNKMSDGFNAFDQVLPKLEELANSSLDVTDARFEWVDGILVQALEQGKWLILDNANLCSSAVLDRLNSLLEPNGTLIISERPDKDGAPKIVKPHPNFRIFLTVDPKYGELSRAMRNRAVELFLLPSQTNNETASLGLFLSESSLYRLRNYFHITGKNVSQCNAESLEDIASDHLSLCEYQEAELLDELKEASQSQLVSPRTSLSLMYSETASGFYHDISSSNGMDPSFSSVQPIVPLNNEAFVSLIDPRLSLRLSALWDLFRVVGKMERSLNGEALIIHQQRNDAPSLSSIAATATPNRSLNKEHKLLHSIHNSLCSYIEAGFLDGLADKNLVNWINTINTVVQFWWKLFDLFSSTTSEGATIQALLMVGQSFLIIGNPAALDESSRDLIRDLQRTLRNYVGIKTMSAGIAIKSIWAYLKPKTPWTYDALLSLQRLERLADQFDASVFRVERVPFDELAKIHQSFTTAFKQVRSNPETEVKPLLRSLDKLLAGVLLSDEGELHPPFFSEEFEAVCQYRDLQRKVNPVTSMIPLFAQRKTKHSLLMEQNEPASSLYSLHQYLGFSRTNRATPALHRRMAGALMRKLSRPITEVVIKDLPLLTSEVVALGHHLATGNTTLYEDPCQTFTRILRELFELVLQSIGIEGPLPDAANYPEYGKRLADVFGAEGVLGHMGESQFQRVYNFLFTPLPKDDSLMTAVANAWIQFAIGCILLYVPDRPCDPSLEQVFKRELWQQRRESLESRIEALQFYEEEFTGVKMNKRIRFLLQQLVEQGEEPAFPTIARPPQSEVGVLQGEFNNVLRLVESVISSETDSNIDSTVGQNLLQLIQRLSEGYRAYDDITWPAVGFLECLHIGVELKKMALKQEIRAPDTIRHIQMLTPFFGATPLGMKQRLGHLDPSSPQLLSHALEAIAVNSSVEGSLLGSHQGLLVNIFEIFYSQWKARLQSDQNEAAVNSSLYRYHGREDDNEHSEQQDFNDLFPTYDTNESTKFAGSNNKSYSPQATSSMLADVHAALFGDRKDQVGIMLNLTEKATVRASQLESAEERLGLVDSLPAILLALGRTKDSLHSTALPTNYSFYTGANLVEARKLIRLVNMVEDRFRQIHVTWPEHATPIEVLTICKEALSFRHVEPLAKFLTKIEKLHATINEWQIIASKEWSAETIFDALTNLIISWRQMELSTWARMLDAELMKCAEHAKSWWFIAYENLIARPVSLLGGQGASGTDLSNHTCQILETLKEFLVNTTMGQYGARVKLLRGFQVDLASRMAKCPGLEPMHRALANFVDYFAYFLGPVHRAITNRRTPLEKKIQEVIKLATWKDRNVHALKQSSKASHNNLYKIIKKFRASINEPVSPIIDIGVLPFASSAIDNSEQTITWHAVAHRRDSQDSTATSLCVSDLPGWTEFPARFKNITATVSVMSRKSEPIANAVDAPANINASVSNLEESMSKLRKETPNTLTEENVSVVKHLKVRKRKLFADVLREAKQMGFQSSVNIESFGDQSSMAAIFASLPIIAGISTPSLQYDFYKLIELMPSVRQATHEHSDDITSAEIARSTAYLENMLSAIIRQRRAIVEACRDQAEIQKICDSIAAFWKGGSCAVTPGLSSINDESYDVCRAIKWLAGLLDVAQSVISAQEKLGDCQFIDATDKLREWQTKFKDYEIAFGKIPLTPHGLRVTEFDAVRQEASKAIYEFRDIIADISANNPSLGYLVKQIEPWTRTIPQQYYDDETEELTFAEAIEDVTRSTDLILTAIQYMERNLASMPASTEDDSWLVKVEDTLDICLDGLNAVKIVPSWRESLDSLHSLPQAQLNVVTALITTLYPVLWKYSQIHNQVLAQLLDLHHSTCKMSHELAKAFVQIARQGFCTPTEKPSGSDNQMEKMEDGTGLGEGDAAEGAEDISKDLTGEEDLEELAQQPKSGDDEGDFEDEKDAVQMADEMEGEAEQDEESVEDAEGEDAGGDSDQGVDSEIGSVDDMRPGAVDEKMWDEAAEKDAEDREADDRGTGSKESADQIASKEKQEKEKKNESDDEENDDDDNATDNSIREDGEAMMGTQPENVEMEHPRQEENLNLPEDLQIGQGEDDGLSSDSEAGSDLKDRDDVLGDEEEGDDEMESPPKDTEDGDQGGKEEDENSDYDQPRDKSEPDEKGAESDKKDAELDQQQQTLPTEEDSVTADDVAESEAVGGANPQNQEEVQEGAATGPEGQESAESTSREPAGNGASGQLSHVQNDMLPDEFAAQGESENVQQFKQIGDALERWYRQQRQIHGPQDRVDDPMRPEAAQEVDMANAEFQHLQNDSDVAETQAMGNTTDAEAKAVDTSQAVDVDEDQSNSNHPFYDNDELDASETEMDTDDPTIQSKPDNEISGASRAFVGDRKEDKAEDSFKDTPMQNDEEEFDSEEKTDLDTLSTLSLSQEMSGQLTLEEARALWNQHESATRILSLTLTEHLRLILTPTRATKMRGDYRTGKRLNMKRIIPYIASEYKRDKIWMRRSVPSKREYQIMLAIDDSSSMADSGGGHLALATVALISRALTMLEAGELCVGAFGEGFKTAHAFDTPFTGDSGAEVFKQFAFQQKKTDVKLLLEETLRLFREARLKAGGSASELWQLQIIISDGICDDHSEIKRLLRQAQEEKIMVVFVIVDAVTEGKKQSILELQEVDFGVNGNGDMEVRRQKYLDTFPFQYYLIVRDVAELPSVLAGALRQWFAEVVDTVS
ncbi:MAG: hypothetical protein M1820_001738 [Bogoriella megaspora]|nr:MAG: hypothetical protein M1820_001738 [Bogoriella megaspora]